MAELSASERDKMVLDLIFRLMDETGSELVNRDSLMAQVDGLGAEKVMESVQVLTENGQIKRDLFLGGNWVITAMSDHELLTRYESKGIDVGAEQKRLLREIVEHGSVPRLDGVPEVLMRSMVRTFLGRRYIEGHLGHGSSFIGTATATGRRWLEEHD
ncbi:hypothetical protein AB0O52_17480 [Arthrobacter sp. NPDC080073]|uniref:hypothetical protein n=1 Tax=Arthrobacter sp. NPDC080073 TaxID=3155919 RepID=UPI00343A23D0